jgi:hypothetical protein
MKLGQEGGQLRQDLIQVALGRGLRFSLSSVAAQVIRSLETPLRAGAAPGLAV